MSNWVKAFFFQFVILDAIPGISKAQGIKSGQANKIMSLNVGDTIHSDTTKIIEDAPLDIGKDRGLFIVTPDKKMQLRILGSVRYLVVYDNVNFGDKNSLDILQQTER